MVERERGNKKGIKLYSLVKCLGAWDEGHGFFLETTGKAGAGETRHPSPPHRGVFWADPAMLRPVCPARVAVIQPVTVNSWERCLLPRQSLPWLPSPGGWIPTALPVATNLCTWNYCISPLSFLQPLLAEDLTSLHSCYNSQAFNSLFPHPSLYNRGLVL